MATSEEIEKYCRNCVSRDFVNGKGLVCKRTGELPAFEEECDSFEQDKELERLAPPKPEDFPVFMTEEEMLAEENLPKGILCAKDSIILTLACGKYRFNDLDLGGLSWRVKLALGFIVFCIVAVIIGALGFIIMAMPYLLGILSV